MAVPEHSAPVYEDLLRSAQRLSFDLRRIDLEDSDRDRHGMTPEWSPLFGTPTWTRMPEAARRELTRCEVAHYLGVAIWLEVALQIVLLRRNHSADPTRPDVKFLFNECADENLHSLMFADAIDRLGAGHYRLDRSLIFTGWLFRNFAWGEIAYAIVLAGEEMFDVMQRDWMADDRVAETVRRTSYVHVVEESRHMAFARQRIRDHLERISRTRRCLSTILIAVGTHLIAKGLINRRIYRGLGMEWRSVRAEIGRNEHHRMMYRRAAAPLVAFLDEEDLLNGFARWIYRKSNLL
ncbi:diiron oxygenase [Nocardia sp. NPDC047654]|uniref:AurF N-oxygenase family protein n=1 Tax=Nocardia sp. NPDC047654 TaxID=3364314 RepID=UPI003712B915